MSRPRFSVSYWACGSPLPAVAIELVIAGLAATQPGPACHRVPRESGSTEYGGPQQRRYPQFAWQTLLFGRNLLPDLERRDGDELLIHQIGSRQVAVKCRTSFAEQVLHSVRGAKLLHCRTKIERFTGSSLNYGDVRM